MEVIMSINSDEDEKIYKEMKKCVQELDLPIIDEMTSGDMLVVYSAIKESSFSFPLII